MEKYYLASLESIKLDNVRECSVIKNIKFNTGKNAIVVKMDKPLTYTLEKKELSSDIAILTARHENFDVINISYFPTFVYVTVLKKKNYEIIEKVKAKDLLIIGIGELYRTSEDAKNHKFD